MSVADFRSRTRAALQRAKIELAANDDHRLRYAALELRLAMEAIVYTRAEAYEQEIPPAKMAIWQPRQLLTELLNIDPYADQSPEIRIGREENGQPATSVESLGRAETLSIPVIKKHYDALGAYLHTPTLKQISTKSEPPLANLRVRCEQLVLEIERVLASPLINADFRVAVELDCMRCGKLMRKRMQPGKASTEVRCFDCNAEYLIEDVDGEAVRWTARRTEAQCPYDDCGATMKLWDDQLRPGVYGNCPTCQKTFDIGLVLATRPPNPPDA